jgi:outer membrane protein TolC
MQIIRFIPVILLLLVSGLVTGQRSLHDYLKLAAENNPDIKSAFSQYQAALEKVPQVGSLPDPQASFGIFTRPMELMDGEQVGNVQVMQMLPWPGTLKTARNEASFMAMAKYDAFKTAKADLFYQVKQSWYQLMKYDHEIDLVRENIELLESLEKLVLVKLQSPAAGNPVKSMAGISSINASSGTTDSSKEGMSQMNNAGAGSVQAPSGASAAPMSDMINSSQSGMQDVIRVKMEILDQKNRLAQLNDQRKTEQARFNAFLNREVNTPVTPTDSLVQNHLPADKVRLADSILFNNPMLAMLSKEEKAYLSMEEKANKMGLPMVGFGLNYMLIQKSAGNESMMNGKDMIMPMVTVSLPLFRQKYRAMKNEAQLMQEAARQQITGMKNNLLVQSGQLIQELNNAERNIELYGEQKELAGKATDLLLSGYATTGSNYEEVLRMQMKVLDYGFKYVEAVTDYNTAVAMAENLMNALNWRLNDYSH